MEEKTIQQENNHSLNELKEEMMRIQEEAHEVQTRIINLENYMDTDKHLKASEGHKQLIAVQLYLMASYYQVLCVRLSDMADEATTMRVDEHPGTIMSDRETKAKAEGCIIEDLKEFSDEGFSKFQEQVINGGGDGC